MRAPACQFLIVNSNVCASLDLFVQFVRYSFYRPSSSASYLKMPIRWVVSSRLLMTLMNADHLDALVGLMLCPYRRRFADKDCM